MVVDTFEHEEADGPVGGTDKQDSVYPGGMIGSEESSTVDRDIFLALQIEAVNRVGGNREQQADQGIGKEPKNAGEGAGRAYGRPEKEGKRAKPQEALGDDIDQGCCNNFRDQRAI